MEKDRFSYQGEEPGTGATDLIRAYEDALGKHTSCSITDLDGVILYANKNFSEISMYPNEELLGMNYQLMNSGFQAAAFFDQVGLVLSSGEIWQNEVINKAKDGSYYWADVVIAPIRNAEGRISRYLLLLTQISDRIKAKLDVEKKLLGLRQLLIDINNKLNAPASECIRLIELCEKKGLESISIPDLKKIFSNIRTNAAQLQLITKELAYLSNYFSEE